jgi:hypothetical protein
MVKVRAGLRPVALGRLITLVVVGGCAQGSSPPPSPRAAPAPVARPLAISSEPPKDADAGGAAVSEPVTDWKTRLDAFYKAYEKGPEARAAEYERLFAETLTQFITLRNVSRSRAIAVANAFFDDKSEIEYRRVLGSKPSVSSQGTKTLIELELDMSWVTPVPAAWESELSMDDWMERGVRHERRARVTMLANAEGRVLSYDEKAVKRHFRVTKQGDGRPAFELPHSEAEPGYQGMADIRLKAGTIVEDGDRHVRLRLDGPQPEQVREIAHSGKRYWTREAAFWKVDNPNGGTSVGGSSYLERTD